MNENEKNIFLRNIQDPAKLRVVKDLALAVAKSALSEMGIPEGSAYRHYLGNGTANITYTLDTLAPRLRHAEPVEELITALEQNENFSAREIPQGIVLAIAEGREAFAKSQSLPPEQRGTFDQLFDENSKTAGSGWTYEDANAQIMGQCQKAAWEAVREYLGTERAPPAAGTGRE